MEYISSRSDTIQYFHEHVARAKMLKLHLFEQKYIPYPLKTNKFSFYFMIIDDEIMELFSVFVFRICVFVYYIMSDNDNKSELLNLRNKKLYICEDKFLSHDNACIQSNNIPIFISL